MIFREKIETNRYILGRNYKSNLEVFSIDTIHRFGMVLNHKRCVLRFRTVTPWIRWGIGIGMMAPQMSNPLHKHLHFGI